MRIFIVLVSILVSNIACANGISTQDSQVFEQFCHQGADYHERRVFDAISTSEFINWSKVEIVSIDSRLNYTRTLLAENHPKVVDCDLVINYYYDDKDVVISTRFRVETENSLTLSETAVTQKAVNDFIVRVMVD
ncbi:hypothetical protein [Vibrio gallicus]|uniref:hypothetical protein n=1 Tax=Vibrio gallicus TaxID=190897 RepID=UPI0021C28722|nr:hypothetical protein [Vibrio gallicus]